MDGDGEEDEDGDDKESGGNSDGDEDEDEDEDEDDGSTEGDSFSKRGPSKGVVGPRPQYSHAMVETAVSVALLQEDPRPLLLTFPLPLPQHASYRSLANDVMDKLKLPAAREHREREAEKRKVREAKAAARAAAKARKAQRQAEKDKAAAAKAEKER